MAKFEKGNKAAKGGRRNPPGGRPSKREREIKKAVDKIALKFIEKNIKPVLKVYLKLAAGHTEKRYTESGKEYEVFVVDAATTRHWIDKLVPNPKQEIGISGPTIDDLLVKAAERKHGRGSHR